MSPTIKTIRHKDAVDDDEHEPKGSEAAVFDDRFVTVSLQQRVRTLKESSDTAVIGSFGFKPPNPFGLESLIDVSRLEAEEVGRLEAKADASSRPTSKSLLSRLHAYIWLIILEQVFLQESPGVSPETGFNLGIALMCSKEFTVDIPRSQVVTVIHQCWFSTHSTNRVPRTRHLRHLTYGAGRWQSLLDILKSHPELTDLRITRPLLSHNNQEIHPRDFEEAIFTYIPVSLLTAFPWRGLIEPHGNTVVLSQIRLKLDLRQRKVRMVSAATKHGAESHSVDITDLVDIKAVDHAEVELVFGNQRVVTASHGGDDKDDYRWQAAVRKLVSKHLEQVHRVRFVTAQTHKGVNTIIRQFVQYCLSR
ncbi:hypothetical protein HDU86_004173 [Geranomyces michiganensis]|nr:hypothetical protein HDU86_004173 [Geranomyces michiganensis]